MEVLDGIARVYCPCEETEGMTLAFLQSGDQLRTDRLCSEGVCVEALTPLCFISDAEISTEASGYDAVNEWTLQLLRIRHLGNAEQRLQALFALLVNRLGRRCGDWCKLPFRLTHERIGELIGSTELFAFAAAVSSVKSRFNGAPWCLLCWFCLFDSRCHKAPL